MSKISDDLFLDISQNFPANYLPKILTTVFRHFSQFLLFLSLFFLYIFFFLPISTFSFSFLSEHLSGCPLILDARGRSSLFTHLPLLFRHLPMHFFSENSVVGCQNNYCTSYSRISIKQTFAKG